VTASCSPRSSGSIERIVELSAGRTSADIDHDRDRRDALLWNFKMLGEAVGQVSDETKHAHPDVAWVAPMFAPHASLTHVTVDHPPVGRS
jgi:Ribonuclease HepT-like